MAKLERVLRCTDRSGEMCTKSGLRLGKEQYDDGNLILQNPKNGETIIAKWGVVKNGKFYEPCQNDCTSVTCLGLQGKNYMCRRKMKNSDCGYYAEI